MSTVDNIASSGYEQQQQQQPTPVLANARIAAIVLSSISAAASLMVIISYIHVFRRFQAHQRKILNAAAATPTPLIPAALAGTTAAPVHSGMDTAGFSKTLVASHQYLAHGGATAVGGIGQGPFSNNGGGGAHCCHALCFSCESSLATPCANNASFFLSPDRQSARQLSAGNSKNASSAGGGGDNTSRLVVYRSSMPPLPSQGAAAASRHPCRSNDHCSSRATSLDRHRIACNPGGTSCNNGTAGRRMSNSSSSNSSSQEASAGAANHPLPSLASWKQRWCGDASSIEMSHISPTAKTHHHRHEDPTHFKLVPPVQMASTPGRITSPPPPLDMQSGSKRRLLLHHPIAYCNQLAHAIRAAERAPFAGKEAAGPRRARRRHVMQRLPRIPSCKIAVLSGIDLLMHVLWITNTTATHGGGGGGGGGCTATMFFYQWAQLFYMFFLASFATRWALRLRNIRPVDSQNTRQRQTTNAIHSAATLAASLVLSLLPAVLGGTGTGRSITGYHDPRINACWFARADGAALRWAWMSLDLWVALALLLLLAIAVYVCIILSNERRNLMSVIAYPTPANIRASVTTAPVGEGGPSLPKRLSSAYTTIGAAASLPPPLKQQVVYRCKYHHNHHHHHLDPSSRFALPMPPLNVYLSHQSGSGGGGGIMRPPSSSHAHAPSVCGCSSAAVAAAAMANSMRTRSRRTSSVVYSQYPASHPVALAHEALHGRRPVSPAASSSSWCCLRSPGSNSSANVAAVCGSNSGCGGSGFATQTPIRVGSSAGVRQSAVSYSSSSCRHSLGGSSTSSCGHQCGAAVVAAAAASICSCRRHCRVMAAPHMVSPAQPTTSAGMHYVWTKQRHSDVPDNTSSGAAILPSQCRSGATGSGCWQKNRWSQPGCHSHVVDSSTAAIIRDAGGFAAHRHQPPPVPRLFAPGAPPVASSGVPIQSYEAGRQYLAHRQVPVSRNSIVTQIQHQHQHYPSMCEQTFAQGTLVDKQTSKAAGAAAAVLAGCRRGVVYPHPDLPPQLATTANSNSSYKYAKHKSMPVPLGRGFYNYSTISSSSNIVSNAKPTMQQQQHTDVGGSQRLSRRVSGAEGPASSCCSCNSNIGGMQDPMNPQAEPAPVPSSTSAPVAEPDLRADWSGPQWLPRILRARPHHESASSSPSTASHHHRRGQMQRIERRVHRLVTTGAVRVAARALVPLLTQLCMVVWSTMHSGSQHQQIQDALYPAAIILLSLQGLLDMMLYYVFDTQANVSEISLQSYFPPPAPPMAATANMAMAAPISTSVASTGATGCYFNHPCHLHQTQRLSSADPCNGSRHSYDVHQQYVPSSVHNKTSPLDQLYFPHNAQFRQKPSLSSLTSNPGSFASDRIHGRWIATSNPASISQQQQQQSQQPPALQPQGYHYRSSSVESYSNARSRHPGFSVDSLNIRRIDRSSNAMQSDTLNGSDSMAWSQRDVSIHDGNSISQVSANPPGNAPSSLPMPFGQQQQQPQQQQSPNPHVSNFRPFSYQHMPVLNGWEEADLEDH
ncbi:hypothetical protein GGI11_002663 [Coemansia sp. RSA 2049]|nr:hypothetical protein GGI11_002663 [Coemansia sp. RSA 2049]